MTPAQSSAAPKLPSPPKPARQKKRGSLTQFVIAELTDRIEKHIYRAGDRMPSEQQLGQEFGVSRTVIREAVASLRLNGRLVSRQGVGVFVADDATTMIDLPLAPSLGERRMALHILELRIGLEVEAAGLAAERRSARDLAQIVEAFEHTNVDHADMQAVVQADFAFHLSIARASNNPHFPHLLEAAVRDVLFDIALKRSGFSLEERERYEERTAQEHDAIVIAIMRGQPGAARNAMFQHLSQSIARYRQDVAVEIPAS